MTRTETRLAIKALPYMTAETLDGEWRVTMTATAIASAFPEKSPAWVHRKGEALAYYTDSATDALCTARAMSDRWGREYGPQVASNDA